jgi:nodulation protein E
VVFLCKFEEYEHSARRYPCKQSLSSSMTSDASDIVMPRAASVAGAMKAARLPKKACGYINAHLGLRQNDKTECAAAADVFGAHDQLMISSTKIHAWTSDWRKSARLELLAPSSWHCVMG